MKERLFLNNCKEEHWEEKVAPQSSFQWQKMNCNRDKLTQRQRDSETDGANSLLETWWAAWCIQMTAKSRATANTQAGEGRSDTLNGVLPGGGGQQCSPTVGLMKAFFLMTWIPLNTSVRTLARFIRIQLDPVTATPQCKYHKLTNREGSTIHHWTYAMGLSHCDTMVLVPLMTPSSRIQSN